MKSYKSQLGIIFIIAIVIINLILWGCLVNSFKNTTPIIRDDIISEFISSTGIIILSIAVILGLNINWTRKFFISTKSITTLHKSMAISGFILILIHIATIPHIKNKEHANLYAHIAVWIFSILITLAFLKFFKKQINQILDYFANLKYKLISKFFILLKITFKIIFFIVDLLNTNYRFWKFLHAFMVLALFFSLLHLLYATTITKEYPPLFYFIATVTSISIILFLIKKLSDYYYTKTKSKL